jgi:predicted RecB family nuclease
MEVSAQAEKMMSTLVTASMLYDLIICPHRPSMDLFGDSFKRDEINPFVQLLWEKGTAYEKEVIGNLAVAFLDLSPYASDKKERLTLEAMERGEPLIYSGRISADDLMEEPDLLRLEGEGYVAGDIKSGAGEEGNEDQARLKKHYGVQLSLYTDILERKGLAGSRTPFIWDIHGEEVPYDLDELQGKRSPTTIWQIYKDALAKAQGITSQSDNTHPAYSGPCKHCHWYTACLADMEKADDLTLLPDLGRSKRDAMVGDIPTVSDLAAADMTQYINGKKTAFRGIGAGTLVKLQERAKLAKAAGARPYLTAPVALPSAETELFFDIEVDPMRDLCYLHGFVERHGEANNTEEYFAFFADSVSAEEEERAFAEAWAFIRARQPCVVYYYSKYERTIWRKLREKYPSVCAAGELEALFGPTQSVDLYFDIVKRATEWPTRDHSIKTLAKYLGFGWRDTHPSGAASIEWFDRWVQSSDSADKQRILDYNEDDCIATRVLLDGIRELA